MSMHPVHLIGAAGGLGAPDPRCADGPERLRARLLARGKLRERLLPTEIAHLQGNGIRHAFLHHDELGSARHLPQGECGLHFPRQVRIIELVRIANPFEWHQFTIFAAKGVTVAGREVRERHFVGAANPGIQVVHLAGKAVRREPLGHCGSI